MGSEVSDAARHQEVLRELRNIARAVEESNDLARRSLRLLERAAKGVGPAPF